MSRRNKKPIRVTAPPAEGRIIDAVMDGDRAYFEEHPSEECYLRDPVPGEFWPQGDPPPDFYVLVEAIAPGFRTRRLVEIPPLPEGVTVH